jgi:hypothetical protein
MRWRALLWRTAGPPLGRVAPGPLRAVYDAMVASAVRALMRHHGVLAVYANGSLATGELRPGSSDADLVAVVADQAPERELALLRSLARPYRRRQAAFPLDLVTIPAGELERAAGFHVLRRGRIAALGPVYPHSSWRLLAGTELRGDFEPDPRLFYLTEEHVARALRGQEVLLRRDAERQGVDWPEANALLTARSRAQLAAAALAVIDRQRALLAVAPAPSPAGWSAPPPCAEAVAVARRIAPSCAVAATLHRPPFSARPELIVEGEPAALARWAAEAGRQAADAAGLALRITTPRLAQDAWRGGLRAASLSAGSVHIGGEPLAPRLSFPGPELLALNAEAHCHALLAQLRCTVLGKRRSAPDPALADRLAAWLRVVHGDPLTAEPSGATGDWALRALRAWRAQASSTPPARIRSG